MQGKKVKKLTKPRRFRDNHRREDDQETESTTTDHLPLPLLFVVGCLIFFSSFVALNGHLLSSSEVSHLDMHIRVDHPESRFYNNIEKSIVQLKVTALDSINKVVGISSLSAALHHSVPAPSKTSTISSPLSSDSKLNARTAIITNNDHRKKTSSRAAYPECKVSFPPSCSISPYVQYWDEETDCFESPLRNQSGLQQPLRQRKYVVFQPDLGGWNNIRMR